MTGPEPESPEIVPEPAEPGNAAIDPRLPRLGWPLALAALAGFFLLTFHLVTGRDDDQLLTGHDRQTEVTKSAPLRDLPAPEVPEVSEAGEATAEPDVSSPEGEPPGAGTPGPADPVRPSEAVALEIESVVFAWADAWSRQDPAAYLELYAADYRPDGLDRGTWESQRRARIIAPEKLAVSISDLGVEVAGPERATARFHQLYATEDKALTARKVLELERRPEGWKIVGERLQ